MTEKTLNPTDLRKQIKANADAVSQCEARLGRLSELTDEVYQLRQAVRELQEKVVDLLNKS